MTDTGIGKWEEIRAEALRAAINTARSAPAGQFIDLEKVVDAALQAAGVKGLVEAANRVIDAYDGGAHGSAMRAAAQEMKATLSDNGRET